MKIVVEGRMDLFTSDGAYLFSVMQGSDSRWRRIMMYKDPTGKERIGNINMIEPDYQNKGNMNEDPK